MNTDQDHHLIGQMREMNEALVLGAIRQHELTEAAEMLNARLATEIAERRQAEESVRLSEVRYRRLFEAAGWPTI
jgi:putative heme iron utilization protein